MKSSFLVYWAIAASLSAMFLFGARFGAGHWPWEDGRMMRSRYDFVADSNGVLIFRDEKGDLWWLYRNVKDGGSEFGLTRVRMPVSAHTFLGPE